MIAAKRRSILVPVRSNNALRVRSATVGRSVHAGLRAGVLALALSSSLALALGIICGCKIQPRKEQRIKNAEAQREAYAEIAPVLAAKNYRNVPVGEISAVSKKRGFVVVKPRSLRVNIFVPGAKLEARSGQGAVTALTLVPEHNSTFNVADFDGAPPSVGDLVFFVSPPGPIEPPPL